jgi:hypothetical protein
MDYIHSILSHVLAHSTNTFPRILPPQNTNIRLLRARSSRTLAFSIQQQGYTLVHTGATPEIVWIHILSIQKVDRQGLPLYVNR